MTIFLIVFASIIFYTMVVAFTMETCDRLNYPKSSDSRVIVGLLWPVAIPTAFAYWFATRECKLKSAKVEVPQAKIVK